jgi:signal transduction histidine kinase
VHVSTHPALAAFVSSPDLVVLVDREQRILARNPAAAGFELDAQGRDAVARALTTQQAQAFEWGEGSHGGCRVWFAASAWPLEVSGDLIGVIVSSRDVTALRLLNAQLEQRGTHRTRQLQAALHDLEAFNAMVSHDLRAPLAVIQMGTEVLQEHRDLTDRAPPVLARIQRAVDTMSRMLDDLLVFARVGEGALQSMELDITALCGELVVEQRLAHPGRSVDVCIEPGLRTFADPALARVAFANVIGNAWKYTGRVEAPRIEIGVVEREDGRALYVRDNGIGFDMREHDKLFTPFVRLGNAREFKGTGVGLATVQRIIDRHGGKVRAEGALGQGATFFVYFPWRA